MIANFKSFLEVNLTPGVRGSLFLISELSIIPINIAITAAPITCVWISFSMSPSIKTATSAMASDRAMPGDIFNSFLQ